MQNLHSAMVGIGYALIVLFFAISLFKNTMNFHELKRPEAALHYLIRFVAAKALVGYGMDIMLNIFSICNGVVSDMAAGMGGISQAMVTLPGEVQSAIENVGFLASIPLWLVTILGSLFITVLSFVMILTVYGRFFRIYMYTALAPLPLASFAGAPSLNRQTFRPFFQINAFPTLYNFMVVNSEFLHRCIDTQMFFFHGFYNHSLEFRRISFVWYFFWHSKTPHLLDSISYCLTNGVLFKLMVWDFCFYSAVYQSTGTRFLSLGHQFSRMNSLKESPSRSA